MSEKTKIFKDLREEFELWEEILAGLSEEQITAPVFDLDWSIKDVVAHLWAWQQRSIARMEAALYDKDPEFPEWPEEFDPEIEEQPHELNAWLFAANRDKPWAQVYSEWKQGYLHLIQLGEQIPEEDLLETGKYSWLAAYPLSEVLTGSWDHHVVHRGWLPEWAYQGQK